MNRVAQKQLTDAHQSLTLTLTLTIHALHTDVLGTLHAHITNEPKGRINRHVYTCEFKTE